MKRYVVLKGIFQLANNFIEIVNIILYIYMYRIILRVYKKLIPFYFRENHSVSPPPTPHPLHFYFTNTWTPPPLSVL